MSGGRPLGNFTFLSCMQGEISALEISCNCMAYLSNAQKSCMISRAISGVEQFSNAGYRNLSGLLAMENHSVDDADEHVNP